MNNYYIYAHINPVKNEIFYIGKGKDKRCKVKRGRSKEWKEIVKEFGYLIELLEINLTEIESNESEIKWIKRIGRKDLGLGPLVNQTNGGSGKSGKTVSDETRNKIKLKLKDNPLDFNRKLNISKSLSNKKCNVSDNVIKRKSNNINHHRYNKSSAKARKIIQYSIEGNIVAEFNSITEATIKTNISHISRAIAKNKQCNGFIFKYKD